MTDNTRACRHCKKMYTRPQGTKLFCSVECKKQHAKDRVHELRGTQPVRKKARNPDEAWRGDCTECGRESVAVASIGANHLCLECLRFHHLQVLAETKLYRWLQQER